MAYRLLAPLHVYLDNTGVPCAGGTLEFLESGDTTPKDVYSDEALSVNLGNTLTLDSAGRAQTDIWGDESYRVRLYKSDDTLVDEADPITEQGQSGAAIPSQTGNAGKFLTTNGSTLSWAAIREVPDPTGNADKLLTNDGSVMLWKSLTQLGLPEVTPGTGRGKIIIGDYLVQFGSDTFPMPSLTPPHGATKAITFDTAFSATPVCYGAWPNKITIASSGFRAVVASEANTTTMTCDYNVNENTTDPGADVSITVPFSWFAIGLA